MSFRDAVETQVFCSYFFIGMLVAFDADA